MPVKDFNIFRKISPFENDVKRGATDIHKKTCVEQRQKQTTESESKRKQKKRFLLFKIEDFILKTYSKVKMYTWIYHNIW